MPQPMTVLRARGLQQEEEGQPKGCPGRTPRRFLRRRRFRSSVDVIASALREASATTVVVAAAPDSPLRTLDLPHCFLVAADADDPERHLGSHRDAGGLVLDGVLDRAEMPEAVLGTAYERLRPGGVLALTLARPRRRRGRGALRGEALPALLFKEGFESPRFFPTGNELTVIARRSAKKPPTRRRHRLTVVMPVYNERATFKETMERVLDKDIPGVDIDVVVVESNSTDGTREDVLAYSGAPRVQVVLEDRAKGKGHAVRRGLQEATGDFVLIQDADVEYDVGDYDKLLEPLRRYEVGFVLGMRTGPDGSWAVRKFGQQTLLSHLMNVGHLLFLALFNVVYRQRLRDPFTMYKVFRRDCLEGLTFDCDRFDFDWELTAKLVRSGYRPLELPVSYQSRSFADGKKVTLLRDPLTWVRACFRYRFSRLHAYR